MKTFYVCEVCGLTSEEKEKVEHCEEQGTEAKYSIGQSVTYLYAPKGVRLELEGEIVEVKFDTRTHDVSYGIFVGENLQLSEDARRCFVKNCVHRAREGQILTSINVNA